MSSDQVSTKETIEIKQSLLMIYEKIQNNPTKEVGYELYKRLIEKCNQSGAKMIIIIQQLSDYITSISVTNKEPGLRLLSLLFLTKNPSIKELNYNYIPAILSILQNLIKDTNINILPLIATTYADIVSYTMETEFENYLKEMTPLQKKSYEILQGFCIFNMKHDNKSQKICGSLCLTKLVENCPIVLQPNYMQFIWGNIMTFIEKKNFCAKYEVLNCLISLILGGESLFKPFANETVYRIMEFLTDNDWLKRKLALNILYTIAYYCMPEISDAKEHITKFLKLLKTDKVKEVREVAMSILKLFNNDRDTTTANNSLLGYGNSEDNSICGVNGGVRESRNINKTPPRTKSKSKGNLNSGSKPKKNELVLKKMRSDREKYYDKKTNNSLHIKTDPTKAILYSEKNIDTTKSVENVNYYNDGRIKTLDEIGKNGNKGYNSAKNNSNLNFKKRAVTPQIINRKRGASPIRVNKKTNNNGLKECNSTNDILNTNISNNNISNNVSVNIGHKDKKLDVNRKEDNSFINEKMVIKTDPKKSIFNSNKNKAFFQKAKQGSGDVILVDKKVKQNAERNEEDINKTENNQEEGFTNYVVEKPKKKVKQRYEDKFQVLPEYNTNEEEEKENKNLEIEEDNENGGNSEKKFNENNTSTNEYSTSNLTQNTKTKNTTQNTNSNLNNKDRNTKSEKVFNIRTKNSQKLNELNDFNSLENNSKNKFNVPYTTTNQRFTNNKIENNEEEIPNASQSSRNNFFSSQDEDIPKNFNKRYNKSPNRNKSPNSQGDSSLLQGLLSKMNNLSLKQIELINTLQNLQESSQNQISQLNNKIDSLEDLASTLTSQLQLLRSKNKGSERIQNYDSKRQSENISMRKKDSGINEEISKILSMGKEQDLIQLLSDISLNEIKNIDVRNMEDIILKLITILSQGRHMKLIISFYKTIVLAIKVPVKPVILDNIQEILEYISSEENTNYYNLTNDEMIDVNILLTTLDKK